MRHYNGVFSYIVSRNAAQASTRPSTDRTRPAGPGVYDVHSPAVPPVEGLRGKIKQFVDTGVLSGHPERLWINPDCGLKTRDWVEVRGTIMCWVEPVGDLLKP